MQEAQRRTSKRRSRSEPYARPPPLLSVWRIELKGLRNFRFPAVAVREQTVLVIIEFFAGFRRKLEIGALHDGINGTSLLAEAAIDAFDHVDVVARGAATSVFAGLGFDGDCLRRADGFAQFAGDTALLAVRIAPERMLGAKARA